MADIEKVVLIKVEEDTSKAQKSQKDLGKATTKTTSAKTKSAKATDKQAQSTEKYTGAIEGLTNQLGFLPAGLTKAIRGSNGFIKSLKGVKLAIAATGIGLLVIGLAALFTWFTKTEKGADKLSVIMAGIGVVVDNLIDSISSYGELLFNIFTLDFSGAKENLNEIVDIWGNVGDEIATAVALQERFNALEKDQIKFITQEQIILNAIANARLKANDEALSLKEQQKGINDATLLTNTLHATRSKLLNEEINILRGQQGLAENMRSDNKELAELEKKLLQLDQQRDDQLRSLIRRTTTLQNKAAKSVTDAQAARDKVAEDKAKQDAKDLEVEQKKQDALDERNEKAKAQLDEIGFKRRERDAEEIENANIKSNTLIEIEDERLKKLIDSHKFTKDELLVIEAEHQDKVDAIKKKSAETDIDTTEVTEATKGEILDASLNGARALTRAFFKDKKKAAIADALIGTAIGIVNSFKLLPPLNFINAGIVSAVGAAQLATVNSQQFARGGMLSGALHSQGGIQVEAESGEAIINRRSMANPTLRSLASAINEIGGGIAFAERGMFVGNAERQLSNLTNSFSDSVNQIQAVLVTEDLHAVENRVAVTENLSTL